MSSHLVNSELRRRRSERRNHKIERVSYGITLSLGYAMLFLLRGVWRVLTFPFRSGRG